MDEPMQALAFAGSLRRGSYNRALLHAAEGLAPEGMTIEALGDFASRLRSR